MGFINLVEAELQKLTMNDAQKKSYAKYVDLGWSLTESVDGEPVLMNETTDVKLAIKESGKLSVLEG